MSSCSPALSGSASAVKNVTRRAVPPRKMASLMKNLLKLSSSGPNRQGIMPIMSAVGSPVGRMRLISDQRSLYTRPL